MRTNAIKKLQPKFIVLGIALIAAAAVVIAITGNGNAPSREQVEEWCQRNRNSNGLEFVSFAKDAKEYGDGYTLFLKYTVDNMSYSECIELGEGYFTDIFKVVKSMSESKGSSVRSDFRYEKITVRIYLKSKDDKTLCVISEKPFKKSPQEIQAYPWGYK